ncbi:unnamed protein product [Cyclocybe aegerita]|uniref:Uncharacterized protein n=1 Tax=Cyclocybe aegerita TaxID=1973307 RepID=A0A8S0X163_CYCAE|nr:unnamed protein product [Cyclocybe aegerita]
MTENNSSPRSPVDEVDHRKRIRTWASDVHQSLENENNQQRRLPGTFPSDSSGVSPRPLPSLLVHHASRHEPHGPHPQIRTQERYGPVQIVDSIDLTRDRLEAHRRPHLPHTAPADERGHPRRADGHPPFQPLCPRLPFSAPPQTSSESSSSTLISMGSLRRRRDAESDDDRVRPGVVTPSTARPLPQRPLAFPPRSHVSSPQTAHGTEESPSSRTYLLPRTVDHFLPTHAVPSQPIPLPPTLVHREPASPLQSPVHPVGAHLPISWTNRSPYSSRSASPYGGPISPRQYRPSPYAPRSSSPSFYTPPTSPYSTSPFPSHPPPPNSSSQPGTIIVTFNNAPPLPTSVAPTAARVDDRSSYSYGTTAVAGPRPSIPSQNTSPYIVVIMPPQ